ncbi:TRANSCRIPTION INITIATION FACTOR IIE, ALPHA SUBUNIT, Winged Helix DNA-binding domain containing protein, putative [Babesia bigemina]|uniref:TRANSCRIPTION INITIATION FACTOR IIE, ALPHA SUBUNIT, Winged Helix DNA-binding domain containing protein, putative n=1 Tax=Babesia bigemina TaxID=5866 RepID=A0A061D7E9_BABBI|nr:TRANSCRIPTION INITIATION FACTOR IIE, ALPHA SUBUNIT, Winged Helix DNA-binding domain containing protein, putative [Babesia bigemina]CDR94799.1 TRANSCRIPTION INITIATION FACTOR IIE, ALPHA SUBUNIT, Winged Helix DNA-binding domain containing protein, putative [Babesia bigemina]|eukprot:XP_012766985.1 TRANSCRIPTION INITIATION FACTOR IIE, ALPHA SUBUNIT, Winged Helix DNA-binding domain containing protein, putative [Babesia bigemina]
MATDPPVKGGVGSIMVNTTRKAYDKETFAALVESCTRLFCCDEEIVIADLLLAVERAITERDIESELGLPERKVHEFLVKLERHGLVSRVTTGQTTDILAKPVRQPRSSRDILPPPPQSNAQTFWRLSSYFILAVHYKLSKMEEMLMQRRRSLHECDRFVCPSCNAIYDSLEVQKLEMDGFDAHFICYCGSKVELDDKATKDSIYSSQQQRCEEQVRNLKKCLAAAWGMEVPQFAVYIRGKEKIVNKEEDGAAQDSAAISTVGGASSVVSGTSDTSESLTAAPAKPIVKSLLAEVTRHTTTTLSSNGKTSKIKFRMHHTLKQETATTNQVTLATKLLNEASSGTQADAKSQDSAPAEQANVVEESEQMEKAEDITFYITKLGRSFPLTEAQDYQQHMNNEEFENFLELQDRYLNFL